MSPEGVGKGGGGGWGGGTLHNCSARKRRLSWAMKGWGFDKLKFERVNKNPSYWFVKLPKMENRPFLLLRER